MPYIASAVKSAQSGVALDLGGAACVNCNQQATRVCGVAGDPGMRALAASCKATSCPESQVGCPSLVCGLWTVCVPTAGMHMACTEVWGQPPRAHPPQRQCTRRGRWCSPRARSRCPRGSCTTRRAAPTSAPGACSGRTRARSTAGGSGRDVRASGAAGQSLRYAPCENRRPQCLPLSARCCVRPRCGAGASLPASPAAP